MKCDTDRFHLSPTWTHLRWTCKSPAREFFGRVKKRLWIFSTLYQAQPVFIDWRYLCRGVLSAEINTTRQQSVFYQFTPNLLDAICLLIAAHFLLLWRERQVRKHHILSIYWEVGGRQIIMHIMPIYVSYSHSGIDYQRLLLASHPHSTHTHRRTSPTVEPPRPPNTHTHATNGMTHCPPPKWQNVTFMGKWPASSGTAGVDGKFTATQSFKTQPKGQGLVVGGLGGGGGGLYPLHSRMSNSSELRLLTAW